MIKKTSILIFLFCASTMFIFAQNKNIDSLEKSLNQTNNIENKISVLKKLTELYFSENYYDKSVYYAEKGLKLSRTKHSDSEMAFLELLARNKFKLSKFNISYKLYTELFNKAKKNKNKHYQGIALNGFLQLFWIQGLYDKAVKSGNEAINIFEELNDSDNITVTKLNTASVYLDLKNLKEAEKIYDDVLNNKKNNYDTVLIAGIYEKKGVIQFYKKFYSASGYFYTKALNLYQLLNDELSAAIEIGNIAETYEVEKKYSKALNLYNQAIIIEKKHKYYSGLIFLYEATGKLYIETKQYKNAEKALKKALYSINLTKEKRELPNIYNLLHLLYAKTGNYKKAYEYILKKDTIKDSITGENVQNKINLIRIKYETENAEKENLFLKKAQEYQKMINKRQSFIISIISALLVIIILFAGLLYKFNLKNKKITNTLSEKNKELNNAYSDIKGSINYAGKIQNVMLSSFTDTLKVFSEFIILYKPAYTLSGDFYWSKKINNTVFIAVGGSTGHGIPGALLSITGMSFLNEIVTEDFIQTDVVLNNLRNKIKQRLNQNGNFREHKDGWDIALFSINLKTKETQFSGAFNSMYVITEDKGKKIIVKYKADRQPVGIYYREQPFKSHNIKLKKDDIIWMFTDGFPDQFSEMYNKKYSSKRLKELLLSISSEPMKEQKNILNSEFNKWKGNFEQVDDIMIMGIKL
ncbi:MAG: SpoIIE family protein phosphatase [Chlorobi bacterium]|nr:SpoIIE family protein phosphatase [Chlorobiota bacterium]